MSAGIETSPTDTNIQGQRTEPSLLDLSNSDSETPQPQLDAVGDPELNTSDLDLPSRIAPASLQNTVWPAPLINTWENARVCLLGGSTEKHTLTTPTASAHDSSGYGSIQRPLLSSGGIPTFTAEAMLPSPHARPQNSEHLAAFPDPQQQQYRHPLPPYLSRPSNQGPAPLLNLYTPYCAHDSAPEPVQQQTQQQDNLLRRKTPSGTLPASYNGIGMERPTRPIKHILLPLSTTERDQQVNSLQTQDTFSYVPILPSGDGGMNMGVSMEIPEGTSDFWPIQTPMVWPNMDAQSREGIINYSQSPAHHSLAVLPQTHCYQTPDMRPSGAIFTQQSAGAINGIDIGDQSHMEGMGTGSPLVPGVGWHFLNEVGLYGQCGNNPLHQQSLSQLYQINTPFTPTDFQQYPSLYGAVPTWNQQFKRNSGQAQTPQIINAPVTSPYHMAPFHPFVADPIHHAQGYINTIGGIPDAPLYIQPPQPARARVLAWAHGVYADLVQAAQTQKLSQPPHSNSQFPRPTSIMVHMGLDLAHPTP
ncbi:hypothetical protein DFH27DRAFT_649582 [Peziza echinospora]|nr:hypothetical protein DFH27DRAFT_649582 [Peziza echinospora]